MKQTDEAILLNRISYSDSSLIVTYLTKSKGLQKFIYRGGKKKAASVFPLALSELHFYGRSGSELLNLTSVELHYVSDFQFDPLKSTIAFFIAEIVRKCTMEGEEDRRTYEFVLESVKQLNETKHLGLFPLEFLVRFTDVLGLRPLCEVDSPKFFNVDEGCLQTSDSNVHKCYTGKPVELIAGILNWSDGIAHTKQDRLDAIDVMLIYYKIHIPRFNELDTLQIVKEVLK